RGRLSVRRRSRRVALKGATSSSVPATGSGDGFRRRAPASGSGVRRRAPASGDRFGHRLLQPDAAVSSDAPATTDILQGPGARFVAPEHAEVVLARSALLRRPSGPRRSWPGCSVRQAFLDGLHPVVECLHTVLDGAHPALERPNSILDGTDPVLDGAHPILEG